MTKRKNIPGPKTFLKPVPKKKASFFKLSVKTKGRGARPSRTEGTSSK